MKKRDTKFLMILSAVIIIILCIVVGMMIMKTGKERETDVAPENSGIAADVNEDKDDSGNMEETKDDSSTEKKDSDTEDSSGKDDSSVNSTEEDTGPQELLSAEAAQNLIPGKADGTYVEDKEFTAGKITCDETAIFSGQFVENGKDELVENVAAIKVTNHSEQYLELAVLIYEINGQTATFVVTGLPAGKTVWVLEKTGMRIDSNSEFSYQSSTTSFKEHVAAASDLIEVTSDGNMLTAENKSGKEMENIVVYYKVLHDDGNFLGGITYVVDFGNVKAGESKKTMAGHYMEGKSEIVRIDWQEK